MIKISDLTQGKEIKDIEIQMNLNKLCAMINAYADRSGLTVIITSPFRTKEDQIRIYKEKAIREGIEFDINKVPMKSAHLSGLAVDIHDPKGIHKNWIKANPSFYEEYGVYFERFDYTPNWVHMQLRKPGSGNRFFIP